MRGGLVGSLCFLAFLLSSGVKGQNTLNSQDLQGSQNEAAKTNAASAEQDKASSLSDTDLSEVATNNQDNLQSDTEDRSSSAIAVAHAGASNIGNLGTTPRPSWSVPSNSGFSQANAQASAHASANAGGRGFGYGYPSSSLSSAHANAKALATSGGTSPYGFKGWRSADEEHNLNNQVEDSIDGLANPAARTTLESIEESDVDDNSRMGGGFSNAFASAYAFSGAVSRVVPQNEYILPQLIPGGQNAVACSYEHEIHSIWSPVYQCLICVCIREGWAFKSICVSCNTCTKTPQQDPLVVPRPSVPLLPPSLPESPASCAPLPTNTPFENPLNPCQTCICKTIINVYGREDVQVQCEENPQCVTPPEYVPIRPLPLPSKSEPMPLCQNLPLNVKFPHPTENCMLCICVLEMTSVLVPERRMICQPDPECVPLREVSTQNPEFSIMPYLSTPEPTIIPTSPVPDLIPRPTPGDVEAIPWPPIVPSLPRPPSPLPGPPPHDTCRPYPPNQPFQHPWDECQICVCSELFVRNVINIEVNCYTKKSCCVEPPLLPGPRPLIHKPVPSISHLGNYDDVYSNIENHN